MKYLLLLTVVCFLACSGNKYEGIPQEYHALLDQSLAKAGENAGELKKALDMAPAGEKEGMAFLIAYMPERDLKELKADLIIYKFERIKFSVWNFYLLTRRICRSLSISINASVKLFKSSFVCVARIPKRIRASFSFTPG